MMAAFLLGSLFRRWVLSIAILLIATSPSIGWMMPSKSIIINYSSSRRSSFSSQQKPLLQSFQIDHEEITNGTPPSIIDNDDGGKNGFPPLLRICKRIGSGAYGTVHIAQLVNNNDDKKQYIAKRAWTLAELELDVPSAVMQLEKNSWNHPRTGVTRQLLDGGATGVVEEGSSNDDGDISSNDDSKDELKERADRCRYYWNVERHIFQKLSSSSSQMNVNINNVTPQFMGVFQSTVDDDDVGGEEEIVPGYGAIGKHDTDNNNNNNKQLGGGFFSMNNNNNNNNNGDDDDKGHEWMVFECIASPIDSAGNDDDSPALTLLDAMERRHPAGRKRASLDVSSSYETLLFSQAIIDVIYMAFCRLMPMDISGE